MILVRRTSQNEILLEVTDDGPGSTILKPGTGTIVIDAWVSKLGGSKEIESINGAGFVLRVKIKS